MQLKYIRCEKVAEFFQATAFVAEYAAECSVPSEYCTMCLSVSFRKNMNINSMLNWRTA